MIEGITVDAERTEVNTDVTFTAVVKDEDTSVDQLKFEWKADAGTFSGEGPSVKWRAPTDISTPADYTITLTVTETYGAPDALGVRPKNVSTATSPAIRVHNSPKELGDMSILFLKDFATSSTPSSTCLRNFSDSCPGKAEEKSDIDNNRAVPGNPLLVAESQERDARIEPLDREDVCRVRVHVAHREVPAARPRFLSLRRRLGGIRQGRLQPDRCLRAETLVAVRQPLQRDRGRRGAPALRYPLINRP